MAFFANHQPQPTASTFYIEAFFRQAADSLSSGDAYALGHLVNPATRIVLTWSRYQNLRNELVQAPDRVIGLAKQILPDGWPAFTEMLLSYLHFVAASDRKITSGRPKDLPEKMNNWLTKQTDFLVALNSAFSSQHGAVLNQAVKRAHSALARMSIVIDRNLDPRRRKHSRSELVLNPLLRSYTLAIQDRNVEKHSISLDLANNLFKLYTFTYRYEDSTPIFKQVVENNLLISFSEGTLSKPTTVTYYYYLGRQELYNGRLIPSLNAFQTAYDLTPPVCVWHRNHILKRLLLISLIFLDNRPTNHLWSLPEAQGLQEYYEPVSAAIHTGDFREFQRSIGYLEPENAWRIRWWKANNLYWALEQFCPPLIWRNLIRRVALITDNPILTCEDLARVVQLSYSYNRPEIYRSDEERPLFLPEERPKLCQKGNSLYYGGMCPGARDVESVCLSLFGDGLIKGYLAREVEGTRIVLYKDGAFPRIHEWAVQVAKEKEAERKEEEEWEAREKAAAALNSTAGGGRVVRLSGLKTIGES